MPKRLCFTESGTYMLLEPKEAIPEQYQEEQEKLKQAFDCGHKYFFKSVYRKTCPTCGDIFYTTAKGQIYDTDKCKYKGHREKHKRQPPICICEYCGAAFTPKRKDAKFCSEKCKQADYRLRKKATAQKG